MPTTQIETSRRPDIQGLRAIAVLTVVAFHAGLPMPGGFIGVDIFFVISGFVITAMLHREWAATGSLQFGRFYLRRFKRLTPALALIVAVTSVISILVQSPFGEQQTTAKTAIGAMFLAANFVISRITGGYFDAPAQTNPLLHTWSLSVEEQFYLVFPLVLAVAWSLLRRGNKFQLAPVALVTLIAVASFFLAILGAGGYRFPGSSTLTGFYSPFTRAWEFAVGALLALVATKRTSTEISNRVATSLGVIGMAILCVSLWTISERTPFPGFWTLLPVSATALLLLAGSRASNSVTRLLATAPMTKIGDWSYSIYLWHWPFIVVATSVWPESVFAPAIAALTSLIPAILSFRYVEQPMRVHVPVSRVRLSGLIVATILFPMVFVAMLVFGSRAKWWTTWPDELTVTQLDHAAMTRGCTDRPFDPALCSFGSDEQRGTVLLAGDSQAYALADGVIEAAARLGMRTVVSARSGCPLSTVNTTGSKPLDCSTWQKQVIAYAVRTSPEVVVIANRSSGYTRPELGWRTFTDAHGKPATAEHGPSNATVLYELGLKGIVKTLRDAGVAVVILQNVPEPKRIHAPPSILRKVWPARMELTFNPATTISDRSRASQVEQRVSASYIGTVLYDPIAFLCTSEKCPLQIPNGGSIYQDTSHLTRAGSMLLAPSLQHAIQTAMTLSN
jgi:peptidoglycan/LPS O-acetylase OafA/YrhL